MIRILLIGAGGFMGAVLRYLAGGVAQPLSMRIGFPLGTLVVNVVGCFFMGLLMAYVERSGALSSDTRALLTVGVLGGFTTFSAFANETFNAMRGGAMLMAIVNIAANVVLCLVALWLGRLAAQVL